ncbi:OmpA family protein [Sulfuriroseicoccus oceanibius]|uniref:OmpA family protein n=1 Tax=Sulfuriroseicoccus oceanibius TaxID=2707525 RepID=A0A7T7F1N6_9BACT|nr:OmpA family protein [Sulfuriroseicoccus oceanibius]QQL45196.1 OmpA family protein [Sulfuriroseicoccus oceanibius]
MHTRHTAPQRQAGSAKLGIAIFLTLFIASVAWFFLVTLPSMQEPETGPESTIPEQVAELQTPETEAPASEPAEVTEAPAPAPEPTPPAEPEIKPLAPSEFVQRFAEAINQADNKSVDQLLARAALDAEALAPLQAALTNGKWTLVPESPVVELGRTPRIIRWAVLLQDRDDPTTVDRVELDFAADEESATGWSLARVRMASVERSASSVAMNDRLEHTRSLGALDHARRFVDALLALDIEKARSLVDSSRVSDAKLAGLCLIFEEGQFALTANKPMVATVAKENVAWFLVRVFSPSSDVDSQFGLVMKRTADQWTVSEVNLDRLLSFYAEQFGNGDRYYTPIIENPKGGDLIVLYFGFDDAELAPRTMRQLAIVANALKSDPNRKVRITGHTDALGTDNYNETLSAKRAAAVRLAFIKLGLEPDQVEIEAAGASQPRRENFLPDGRDNPQGRKANRRAEIYLDF